MEPVDLDPPVPDVTVDVVRKGRIAERSDDTKGQSGNQDRPYGSMTSSQRAPGQQHRGYEKCIRDEVETQGIAQVTQCGERGVDQTARNREPENNPGTGNVIATGRRCVPAGGFCSRGPRIAHDRTRVSCAGVSGMRG